MPHLSPLLWFFLLTMIYATLSLMVIKLESLNPSLLPGKKSWS